MSGDEIKLDGENLPLPRKDLPPAPLPLISCGKSKRRILELLSKGGNPHTISKKLNLARSTIIQHLKELKQKGLTKKDSHGYLWYVTTLGLQHLEGRLGGRFSVAMSEREGVGTAVEWLQKDRAHNLKVKVKIVEEPKYKWLQGWNVNNKIKNNVFYSTRFGDINITYTGKNLIYQLPILYFESSDEAVAEAGRLGIALNRKLLKDFPGLILGDNSVSFVLISQHHAIPNEPYAKFCAKHGFSFRDGTIEVDASKSPELEFTDSEKSHIHHQNYIDHVKDVILNDVPKVSELTKLMGEINKQLLDTQKNIGLLIDSQKILTESQLNTTKNVSKLSNSLFNKDNEVSNKIDSEDIFYL